MKSLELLWLKKCETSLTESLLDKCYNFRDRRRMKTMKKTGEKIWILNEFLFSVLILVFISIKSLGSGFLSDTGTGSDDFCSGRFYYLMENSGIFLGHCLFISQCYPCELCIYLSILCN